MTTTDDLLGVAVGITAVGLTLGIAGKMLKGNKEHKSKSQSNWWK